MKVKIQGLTNQLKDQIDERNEKAALLNVSFLEEEDVLNNGNFGSHENDFILMKCYFEYLRTEEEIQIVKEEIIRTIRHCKEDIEILECSTIDPNFFKYSEALSTIVQKRVMHFKHLLRELEAKLQIL